MNVCKSNDVQLLPTGSIRDGLRTSSLLLFQCFVNAKANKRYTRVGSTSAFFCGLVDSLDCLRFYLFSATEMRTIKHGVRSTRRLENARVRRIPLSVGHVFRQVVALWTVFHLTLCVAGLGGFRRRCDGSRGVVLGGSCCGLFDRFFPSSMCIRDGVPPPVGIPVPGVGVVISVFLVFWGSVACCYGRGYRTRAGWGVRGVRVVRFSYCR